MPVVLDVASQIDRSHATHAKFALDVITAAEDYGEMFEGIHSAGGGYGSVTLHLPCLEGAMVTAVTPVPP
jgi:hypothetical protein